MFFVKRALMYVSRKKSKVLTVAGILTIVTTLCLTGLVINSATNKTFEYAKSNLETSVAYRLDLSSVMAERGVQGRGVFQNLPNDFEQISIEEINYILENSPVSVSYRINATIMGVPNDFEPLIIDEDIGGGSFRSAPISIQATNDNNDIKIIDGRNITNEDIVLKNKVILIEKTISEINDLSVGDEISIEMQTRSYEEIDETTMLYEIIGIYETEEPSDINSFGSLSENRMYAPYTKVLSYNNNITNVIFDLTEAEEYEQFLKYAESLPFSYRVASGNSDVFDKMVGPISSVADTSKLMVFVVIVAGCLIIGLLSSLSIKDRKYELGVLLSLGESRIKIILQLLFESIIVALISFAVAIFITNYTAQATTNFLINSVELNNTESIESEPRSGISRFSNPISTEVEVIDSLSVDVESREVFQMIAIGMVIVLFGSAIQGIFVIKANHKEILLER